MAVTVQTTPRTRIRTAALLAVGGALGTLLALLLAPAWLPVLSASLVGPSPKGYWFLARAAGVAAYLLLWLSVAFGLLSTNRLARAWPGGPTAVDLHQFSSLLALALTVFHFLILLGDRYIGYTLSQLLVPFANGDYRPLWVGLGQTGFYLGLIVAFSFYVRGWIGHRTWRVLHYLSFLVYLLATAHGLGAGTDGSTPGLLALYGLTVLATFFLTVYRVLVSLPLGARAAERTEGRFFTQR